MSEKLSQQRISFEMRMVDVPPVLLKEKLWEAEQKLVRYEAAMKKARVSAVGISDALGAELMADDRHEL